MKKERYARQRDREASASNERLRRAVAGRRRTTRGWPSPGSACRSLGPNAYVLAGREAPDRARAKGTLTRALWG